MINLHERMLPTSAGVEPASSWSPVRRRIQLSHRGRLLCLFQHYLNDNERLWAITHTHTVMTQIPSVARSQPETLWSEVRDTSGDFCRLLITFANSLDPDQAWQNVGPDLNPNCLTFWWYSFGDFCHLLITFENILDLDQAQQNVICIQTVWHSDGIPERLFWKSSF